MSINWVMTAQNDPQKFVELHQEKILFTSPPRVSLQVSSPNSFPGNEPLSIKSDAGMAYITNQRIIYLPSNPAPSFKSFSSPILNISDSYVRAPFFGANYWTCYVRPVAGGNIPASLPYVELRLTFREGGAFDFSATFEQIKERLTQAVSLARENGQRVNGVNGVNFENVHLEQLPAYEAPEGGVPGVEVVTEPVVGMGMSRDSDVEGIPNGSEEGSKPETPVEPPPGYEEAQAQAVTADFDERLRQEAEHS